MPAQLEISIGLRFGRYIVLKESERHKKSNGASYRRFLCLCDCGTQKIVRLSSLVSGTTKSCGCLHKEIASTVLKKTSTTHGKSKTKIYYIWAQMIRRCNSPKSKDFHRYGGRGIKVCERWLNSFEDFESDMGYREPGLTLERIDTNGDYEPNNCKWASYKDQARNTRRNRLHTIDGVTHCLAEWCEILNESWSTVKKRLAAKKDPFVRLRERKSN